MFHSTKRITMFIVSLALFMDVLDSNILNTAIPAMSTAFQVTPIDLKIALISYLLSLAIFIPASGWASDRYGAKNIFIAALGLFTLSSFFCGHAQSLVQLVIARFIQGIGGAFMISLGRLIIARTFKRHELVEAMNTVIIVVSVAVMLGPFIGGVIVDHLSWPWIFWVNIPAGLLTMLFAKLYLKDVEPKKPRPFDLVGFILFGGSLAMLCFSLSEMSASNINTRAITVRTMISIAMLIAYVIYATKARYPIIRIELLRIRTFRISVFGNLCTRLGFGGMPFLLPLMQQIGFGYSAQLSGLLLVPIALGIVFSKLIAIKILRKTGYRKYLFVNTLLVGFILWIFQLITAETPLYLIALLTFVLGVFTSAQFTGMNSLAFAEIQPEDLSASTSITSTIQMLSQSLGVAIGAILLRFFSSYADHPLLLSTQIFHDAFFALGFITCLSAIIFVFLKPEDGKQMLIRPEI